MHHPAGDIEDTPSYLWREPKLRHIPLDTMETMKLFQKLVVNHSMVRVLCRGKEGSSVMAWMTQGLLDMLSRLSKEALSDVQQTAFSELQELAEVLLMLMELKTPQAKLLEALCGPGASEASANLSARALICSAVAKSPYWRTKEARAREVAAAYISLKPEMDVLAKELPSISLTKLAKACQRFPVWLDGLPKGLQPLVEKLAGECGLSELPNTFQAYVLHRAG